MMLSITNAKNLLKEIYLEDTPFYSKERELKFLWYPVFPIGWSETFVLLNDGEPVGVAVSRNQEFEVYYRDKRVADNFVGNVPAVWREYICIGVFEV